MANTDTTIRLESTTYHGQVHGDKPFNADEWLRSTGAAVDHATLCAKLSGQTFASASEWWEAREVASTAELTVIAALVAAHGRLLAAEKLAGAHVDTRGAEKLACGQLVEVASNTLKLMLLLRQHCKDTGATGLGMQVDKWLSAPLRSALDQPLGVLVTLGNTTFGPGCPVRAVIEYAEEQRCRAARLTKAADTLLENGYGAATLAALRSAVEG